MFFLSRRPIFLTGFLVVLLPLALVAMLLLTSGCASNPVAAAQDLEQKAYATYGSFVIFEEAGAKLDADPGVPLFVKRAIRVADAKAKPTADTLVSALQQYESAKAALDAGASTSDKVAIAARNLAAWIAQAIADTSALSAAVKSAPPTSIK